MVLIGKRVPPQSNKHNQNFHGIFRWEVFGDMPASHPMVLIIAMFSRSQSIQIITIFLTVKELLDENLERAKRVHIYL
jgi:hypothetical protein